MLVVMIEHASPMVAGLNFRLLPVQTHGPHLWVPVAGAALLWKQVGGELHMH